MKKTRIVLIAVGMTAAALLVFSKNIYRCAESIALNRTMETDSRREMLRVDRVVETLDLKPGQLAADIGAGTGLFTWPMARKVAPRGVVYAVDINAYLLKGIGEKAAALGLKNVRTVAATENDPAIPEKVDLIFTCGTMHYIGDQAGYFKNLHKYLKPGGRIAIIDLEKSHPVGDRIKYAPEEQEKWMRQAGFVLTGRYYFLKHFYFMVYEAGGR